MIAADGIHVEPAPIQSLTPEESGALAILGEIVHVQREYMREGDPQRMWDELLASLLRTTGSEGGFIGEIVWSNRGIPDLNTRAIVWDGVAGARVAPHPDIGLLVSRVIAEQAPVIVNLSTPAIPGTASIRGFLGLPLLSSDRLVGLVGLTSPDNTYADHWVDTLRPLLATCASIVEALQAAQDRDRLMHELERTASFLQAVIDGTSHGVVVIDQSGRIESANAAAHRIFQCPSGEAHGRPITDFAPREDARRFAAGIRRFANAGVPDQLGLFEARVVGFEGVIHPVEVSVGEIHLDDERRLVVLFHDISDRLQAQSALARAGEILDSTTDLVAWADNSGRVIYLNKGGRAMLELGDLGSSALTIESLCVAESQMRWAEEVLPAATATGTWSGELAFQRLDGSSVPVSVVAIVDRAYVAILARDLTERHEVDRLKEAFVSNVSHELRTPLTAVIGYLELLEEGALGAITEEQTEVLGIMRRNGDRLLDLIGDLLLVGSFESGRPVSSRPVDLANLVDVVTRELSGAGAKAGLALEVRSEGAAWVSGDDGELKTVIANLVGNACKFTPAGGRVGVIVSSRAGFVTLEVSDTGIGIPTEDLDRIFDRFYRGDHARKSEIQGAGLGLAIVDAVVKRHGGSVDITSEPGEGTTFTVTLPASAKGGDADEHGPGGR